MKKAFSIGIIFLIFILIYFIQSNFFNTFTIAGVKPNLFIMLGLFVGLFLNKWYGGAIGVILGLLLDLFIGKIMGINAICLGLAGIMRRRFFKTVFKK